MILRKLGIFVEFRGCRGTHKERCSRQMAEGEWRGRFGPHLTDKIWWPEITQQEEAAASVADSMTTLFKAMPALRTIVISHSHVITFYDPSEYVYACLCIERYNIRKCANSLLGMIGHQALPQTNHSRPLGLKSFSSYSGKL